MPDATGSNATSSRISDQTIPLEDVRIKLARIWLTGSGLTFAILVLQSLRHVYADLTSDAWSWFLPAIVPTLSMIIGVFAYTALDPKKDTAVVRRSFVPFAVWLSIFYLAAVILTVLIQPFASANPAEAVGLMKTSNLWLGPFQGLVTSALGALFASKAHKVKS